MKTSHGFDQWLTIPTPNDNILCAFLSKLHLWHTRESCNDNSCFWRPCEHGKNTYPMARQSSGTAITYHSIRLGLQRLWHCKHTWKLLNFMSRMPRISTEQGKMLMTISICQWPCYQNPLHCITRSQKASQGLQPSQEVQLFMKLCLIQSEAHFAQKCLPTTPLEIGLLPYFKLWY